MNIFKLAELELIREGKTKLSNSELIDKAIYIRQWLDKHRQNTAKKIMQGGKIYQYGNIIKVK